MITTQELFAVLYNLLLLGLLVYIIVREEK